MSSRRVLHDEFFRKAKREGYVARSAYKLLEINDRKRVIRTGDRVLDLGCSPGSWLQVASELVGPRGQVVGIDLNPVRCELAPNVTAMVGDAFKIEPATLLGKGREFDVVLSDMAPNTAGDASDHFRSVELCDRVLELLPHVLRKGGAVAMKVFEGEAYPDLLRRSASFFAVCKGFKPKASRDVSREMYLIGTGFKGNPAESRRSNPE